MIYVLTREQIHIAGSQELVACSLDEAAVQRERDARLKKDDSFSYQIYPVSGSDISNFANSLHVLTKESRMTPGHQMMMLGSSNRKILEEQKAKLVQDDDEKIGVKLYYLYKIHEVNVV